MLAPNPNVMYMNPAWSCAHDQHLDDHFGAPLSDVLMPHLPELTAMQVLSGDRSGQLAHDFRGAVARVKTGKILTLSLGTASCPIPMKVGLLADLFPNVHRKVSRTVIPVALIAGCIRCRWV